MNKLTLKIALISAITLQSTASHACDIYGLIGNVSYHFGDKHNYNETHKTIGVGCEAKKDKYSLEYSIAYTQNSFYNDSIYLATSWNYFVTDKLSTGLTAGVASGYDELTNNSLGIIPIAGLKAEYKFDDFAVYGLVTPPYKNVDSAIIGGLKLPFEF